MMIGIDITSLYVAQAGVFYYRYNLVKAMLALNAFEHQFLLLDYYPIHGSWRSPPEVDSLKAPNAEVRHVQGIRQRKLSRLPIVHKLGLRPLAKTIDETVFAPWGLWEKRVKERQLQRHLAGVDIFHTSDVLAYAAPGAMNVTTIHDMTTMLFPEMHLPETREMQQKKYRFSQEEADAVIAVSHSTKRDIVKLLDIEPERIQVVYEGVDPAFRPLPTAAVKARISPLGLQPGGYILHVGTIEPRKNLVRLIDAYHMTRQKLPTMTTKLVLVGASGWLHQEVFDRVAALELEDEVLFLGKVAENMLPAIYNGALIFAYPSLYEGFGLPPLEAMACGVPVITSNTSSLPEVVGEAGILVNPRDTHALAANIMKLLKNPQERERLIDAGLEQARKFTWKRAAEKTINLYQNLLIP